MQKERIQDPYVFALYLQPLTMSPNYVIPLIPHGGGGGKTQFLRHKPTVFSPLPAWVDSIFKSRDSTLPTKVLLVKAMVFPHWGLTGASLHLGDKDKSGDGQW